MTREDRAMLSAQELFVVAEKEKGSKLTQMDEWWVWTHPQMTFSEIKEMLDEDAITRKNFEKKALLA
jgi:UDP-3-O-[3-hydroxymyristoyl] glucosamine N-acyltransferase